MSYSVKQIGSKYSDSFKMYVLKNGKVISPFHDIPLREGTLVNCVNEIPRFEHAKFEISKEDEFNPIIHDTKKGKLRYVHNIFPAHGYPFNYGALPQTWEDPTIKDSKCPFFGDNDPVDIIEIGSKKKSVGEVYQAKILGALALLDDGEADWKVLVIDAKDEMAGSLNDVEDVRKHMPGLLEFSHRWFRDYKVPDGKPRNEFGFDGMFLNASEARKIVDGAHESWKRLISSGYKDLKISNTTITESIGFKSEGMEIENKSEPDSEVPECVDVFSYPSL